ncbi:MAG: lyase family protein, partial [Acidimicrobiales bacterium]
VHLGATSQDTMDTAAMLVALRAGRAILADLDAAADVCASLTHRHRATLMTGRTLLQPALPMTFGLKAGGWLVALTEAGDTLGGVLSDRLAVQLGGAAGTLAAFGDRGLALSARLAERLGLAAPVLPWHTDRSRVADLAHALVRVASACAKVALDVVLLAQAEVAEVHEGGGPGHGGSSTMPQKANPVGSALVLAAARRAQSAASALVSSSVQDHERAATGGWHAEWQALTDGLRAAGGCASGIRRVLDGLQVDVAQMAANLARTHGTVVAERVALDLAADLGREKATAVVGRATRRALAGQQPLRQALGADREVTTLRSPEELDKLCDPAGYLGVTEDLVERALSVHRSSTSTRGEP